MVLMLLSFATASAYLGLLGGRFIYRYFTYKPFHLLRKEIDICICLCVLTCI